MMTLYVACSRGGWCSPSPGCGSPPALLRSHAPRGGGAQDHRWNPQGETIRISIHLIRIRIQHFRLITDPGPGFWRPKIWKNLQLKKKLKFFRSKTTIYLSLDLHKERPSYRLSLSQKRTSSTSKNEIKKIFYFCGVFLPSWIRIWMPDPDTDPLNWLNPDPNPWFEVSQRWQVNHKRLEEWWK